MESKRGTNRVKWNEIERKKESLNAHFFFLRNRLSHRSLHKQAIGKDSMKRSGKISEQTQRQCRDGILWANQNVKLLFGGRGCSKRDIKVQQQKQASKSCSSTSSLACSSQPKLVCVKDIQKTKSNQLFLMTILFLCFFFFFFFITLSSSNDQRRSFCLVYYGVCISLSTKQQYSNRFSAQF